jgi:hypothetical protein
MFEAASARCPSVDWDPRTLLRPKSPGGCVSTDVASGLRFDTTWAVSHAPDLSNMAQAVKLDEDGTWRGGFVIFVRELSSGLCGCT